MALNVGDACPVHEYRIWKIGTVQWNNGNYGWACEIPSGHPAYLTGGPGKEHVDFGCATKLGSKLVLEKLDNFIIDEYKSFINNDDRYPHICPKCGGKCYIGLSTDHQNITQGVKCDSGL